MGVLLLMGESHHAGFGGHYLKYQILGRQIGDHSFRPACTKISETSFKNKPGVVAHVYNPSYSGGGGRRITI
jgi:hypothetical protein